MSLLHVADCAYPIPTAGYPKDLFAVAGYVGGNTPHVWTASERDAIHNIGLRWWGIWTMPERALTAQDGIDAARGQVAAYNTIPYPKDAPALLDIEHSAYVANPAGAEAAVAAWRQAMNAAGWPVAVPYLPLVANHGWVAQWDNVRPDTLPAGWLGKQYGGETSPYALDLSVFDPSVDGTAARPAPAPGVVSTGPTTPEDEDMFLFIRRASDQVAYLLTGTSRADGITDGSVLAQAHANGIPFLDNLPDAQVAIFLDGRVPHLPH